MRSTELVRFQATDGLALSGLLFEPRRAKSVAIWMHGMGGSIFDSRRTNILAEEFVHRKIAFFPFNNRGAHLIRQPGLGTAYEVIRDCVMDIDGAVREARRRGYRDITMIGHSTGANKIVVYDHYKRRNAIQRYVLLAGGDDTGGLYRELGARRFRALLKRASSVVANSQPARRLRAGHHTSADDLMPDRIMSWRAFYDMANPNGDYNVFPFSAATRGRAPFRFVRAIRKPSLYVYGENDEYGFDAALLARNIGPNGEIVVLRDADHGFHGKEKELTGLIIDWCVVAGSQPARAS